MKAVKLSSLAILFAVIPVLSMSGQVLYQQSFDYAEAQDGLTFTETNFPGEGWSSGTGVITYQHDDGLSYSGVNSAGGALVYDFGGGTGNRNATQDFSLDFADHGEGTIFGITALVQVDRALTTGGETQMSFGAGTVVNRFEFGLTDSNMYAEAWMDGGETRVTGPTYSVGETLAFHLQITQGSGSSPTDSVVEVWFNPDFSNLGSPDFTSTSDTRIGRPGSGNAITDITYGGSSIGDSRYRWDEASVYVIPEPSTYAFIGGLMAFGFLVIRRWRQRKG